MSRTFGPKIIDHMTFRSMAFAPKSLGPIVQLVERTQRLIIADSSNPLMIKNPSNFYAKIWFLMDQQKFDINSIRQFYWTIKNCTKCIDENDLKISPIFEEKIFNIDKY